MYVGEPSRLSAAATSTASPVNSSPTTGKTNTAAAGTTGAEHRGVAEHVWDDEEADVRTADVNLVKMRNAAVAGGDSDILKLDVHVVLGFKKLSTVDMAGGKLESDDVARGLVEQLDRNTDGARHVEREKLRDDD